MKKKVLVLLILILVSSGLIFAGKGFMSSAAPKEEAKLTETAQVKNEDIKPQQSDKTTKTDTSLKKNTAGSEQNKDSTQKTVENDKNTAGTTTNQTNSESKTTVQSTTNPPVQSQAQERPNVIIVDTVAGKTILSKAVVFSGETASKATMKLLDAAGISYRASGMGESIYFSSINGVKERSAGATSGWCYFINGKKPGVGAGSYKLNKDDVLEWRFLKDGVSY